VTGHSYTELKKRGDQNAFVEWRALSISPYLQRDWTVPPPGSVQRASRNAWVQGP